MQDARLNKVREKLRQITGKDCRKYLRDWECQRNVKVELQMKRSSKSKYVQILWEPKYVRKSLGGEEYMMQATGMDHN